MPVYEFKCEDCQKEFEKFLISASKIDEVKCPFCDSKNVKKKISACGVKGSGEGKISGTSSCSPFG
ncbi:FmdB family zinc ribbon protein [Desulfurobacterium atlanticum]|uniref:Putative regulatory protein, FmdB family n=1 Tax=Desulfurobacterium atlanticum TaxID=240169 RepID=A0A238ZUF5_9BACT|nr:zinc ribbon domain-containing protein [Desulfurobacterium atlanticum]SNR87057.1 putative regulatory protein, FmdB family [Desulfurobacterium atlanticum]